MNVRSPPRDVPGAAAPSDDPHLIVIRLKHFRPARVPPSFLRMNHTDVLFVEDSAGDALLTNQILAESLRSVHLRIARDGAQALDMLADERFRPAMIILDLSLPKLSGFDVLERNPRRDIPVVIFSASSNPSDVERTLALGAREYVHKPMDMVGYRKAVLQMVHNWAKPTTG